MRVVTVLFFLRWNPSLTLVIIRAFEGSVGVYSSTRCGRTTRQPWRALRTRVRSRSWSKEAKNTKVGRGIKLWQRTQVYQSYRKIISHDLSSFTKRAIICSRYLTHPLSFLCIDNPVTTRIDFWSTLHRISPCQEAFRDPRMLDRQTELWKCVGHSLMVRMACKRKLGGEFDLVEGQELPPR